jgi:hypothetical protein
MSPLSPIIEPAASAQGGKRQTGLLNGISPFIPVMRAAASAQGGEGSRGWSAEARLALLGILACALIALAVYILFRIRMTPGERERRRRSLLNSLGRIGDAVITDIQGNILYFTYSVHGVSYNASQDVTAVRHLLPEDLSQTIGWVSIKYLPGNPANSMVLCERWSGIRPRVATPVGRNE